MIEHNSVVHYTDAPSSTSLGDDKKDTKKDIMKDVDRETETHVRCELPCEFPGCAVGFQVHQGLEWMTHTEGHFGGTLPSQFQCCKPIIPWVKFGQATMTADKQESSNLGFRCGAGLPINVGLSGIGGDSRFNFELRMRHIREHILNQDFRPEDRVPDSILATQLRDKGIIDVQTYHSWLSPSKNPSSSTEGSSVKHGLPPDKQVTMMPLTQPRSSSQPRSTGALYETQPTPLWDFSTF